jgi:hypothetical protein
MRSAHRFKRYSQMVGLGGLEPPTSPLSGVRSNQLSYRPLTSVRCDLYAQGFQAPLDSQVTCAGIRAALRTQFSLKEVIQPQVPLRLPCYDFTPVIDHTVVSVLPKVRPLTSGAANSHGVTGGVYKARERIHRGGADPRLLAIPTSRSRVADSDPD